MEVTHIRGHKTLNFPFRPSPYVVTLPPGRFKFEAWGAAGNNNTCSSSPSYMIGRGGYTKGIIQFDKVQVISIYVGEKGDENSAFNSAHELMNAIAGGGAIDFRLVNSGKEWHNFSSLKSRIMVAGGGGGADCYKGGDAGGLIGHDGGGSGFFKKLSYRSTNLHMLANLWIQNLVIHMLANLWIQNLKISNQIEYSNIFQWCQTFFKIFEELNNLLYNMIVI